MSRLISIADLKRPKKELEPLLEQAQGLSQRYFDYISNDPGGYEYETERAHSLEEMYHDTLAEGVKYKVEVGSETRRLGGVHASEISGCQRRLVYSIMDTERRVDPSVRDVNMIMRFRLGHAVHAMLQNDFHRMAGLSNGFMTYESEVRINPTTGPVAKEFEVHSATDGIFTFYTKTAQGLEPFIRVGLEIKTMSDKEFEKTTKPKKEHIDQACLYMACLDIPLMWTLYYNKSNSNIATSFEPFLFKFPERVWSQRSMKIVKSKHLAVVQDLPDRDEGRHCKWCAFSWVCQPQILKARRPIAISPGMRGGTQ